MRLGSMSSSLTFRVTSKTNPFKRHWASWARNACSCGCLAHIQKPLRCF